ncbi:ABC transporter permease [Olsenella uli]|uniref:ABC transporter permease n=1 Tax=Olsenella uli TaxID=133926 RepID=UPI003D7AF3B1
MFTTIKVTILTNARRADFWIWCLAFPIILATLFIFMFGSLKNSDTVMSVPVAVVKDASWEGSGFSQVVGALSGGDGEKDAGDGAAVATGASDGSLLDVHEVASIAEGEKLLDDGQVFGVYAVDADGDPKVTLGEGAGSTDGTSEKSVNRSILEAVASSYTQTASLVERAVRENPAILSDPSAIAGAIGLQAEIERVSLTRSTPDDTVRFYYALLGMAALFASTTAAISLLHAAGDLSPLGARRCVGGQGRLKMLTGTLIGCWASAYFCLVLVFLYVRFVAGVDFAGREGLALIGLAAASFLAVTLGMLVAVLPLRGGEQSRTGLLTAVNCGGSLFAGLYGMPAMALADEIARACPAEAWLNPPKLISDTFTDLYFYESTQPFFAHVAVCAGLGVALLAVATLIFRRQRYEHL